MYPDGEREVEMLYSQFHHHPVDDVEPVLDATEVVQLQAKVRAVDLDRKIAAYIVALVNATRAHESLKMGSSPRGTLALFRASQAAAFIEARDYVIPEDVKSIAIPVLVHRLSLETKAKYSGVSKENLVREILDRVPVGL